MLRNKQRNVSSLPIDMLPSPPLTEHCNSSRPSGSSSTLSLDFETESQLEGSTSLLLDLLRIKGSQVDSYARVHEYLRRGCLPVETVALGVLIMARISTGFYKSWRDMFTNVSLSTLRKSAEGLPQNPELIVLASLMLAQKILHDSPYTTATWADIVTQGALVGADINLTERLLLKDLDWNFKDLAVPRNLAAVVAVLRSSSVGPHLTWADVKIMIWRSQARELSGRRYIGPRLSKDTGGLLKGFDLLLGEAEPVPERM